MHTRITTVVPGRWISALTFVGTPPSATLFFLNLLMPIGRCSLSLALKEFLPMPTRPAVATWLGSPGNFIIAMAQLGMLFLVHLISGQYVRIRDASPHTLSQCTNLVYRAWASNFSKSD